MNLRRSWIKHLVLVALIATAIAAPSAHAAVELGSTISDIGAEWSGCAGGWTLCVSVQQTLPSRLTRAPLFTTPNGCKVARGVIVRWRIQGVGSFSFAPVAYEGNVATNTIIVRRFPGSEVRSVNSGSEVSWFPTRVPILAGEHVALFQQAGSWIRARVRPGADADLWDFAPPLGIPTQALLENKPWEFGWNVVVEADRDGDGYGDETQDQSLPPDACPPPPPPPAPPPPPTGDTTAPLITNVNFGRRRLRLTLSETVHLRVWVARRNRGRWRRVRTLRRRVGPGPVVLRVRRRLLQRGRYRAVIRAVDSAGNAAPPVRVGLRVRRRR